MRWEYKTIQYNKRSFLSGALKIDANDFNDQLNRLGGEGWELVSVTASHLGWQGQGVILVFKRAR